MSFGVEEQESSFLDSAKGLGMVGHSGKIRATTADSRSKGDHLTSPPIFFFFLEMLVFNFLFLSFVIVNTKKQQTKSYSGVSTTVSGLASSVVFTPVKGFEINNQNQVSAQEKVKEANLKYFSNAAGFLKVGKKPEDR